MTDDESKYERSNASNVSNDDGSKTSQSEVAVVGDGDGDEPRRTKDDDDDADDARPTTRNPVVASRRERRRRARKLIGKSGVGRGLTDHAELDELETLHGLLLDDDDDDDDENPGTFRPPPPLVLVTARENRFGGKKKKKRKRSEEPPQQRETYDPLNSDQWQRCSGSDHRDVYQRLLWHDNFQRRLPSWCTLRNVVCCRNVAVIEFVSRDAPLSLSSMLLRRRRQRRTENHGDVASSSSTDVLVDLLTVGVGTERRVGLPTRTTLFDENSNDVKTATDVLLYETPTLRARPTITKTTTTTNVRKGSSLTENLFRLRLTKEQRQHHGYPAVVLSSSFEERRDGKEKRETARRKLLMKQHQQNETKQKQKLLTNNNLPSLEEAQALVRDLEVPASFGNHHHNHDDNDDDDRLLFVETFNDDSDRSTPARIYALDCEMVLTRRGAELARMALVEVVVVDDDESTTIEQNHDNNRCPRPTFRPIIDVLVRPYEPVTDHLEQWSGVDATILASVDARLEQAQTALLRVVRARDLLVGHSLENDLRALRVAHHAVADTAVLFAAKDGRKRSLQHLTSALLRRRIQNDANGHSPREDAVAAAELAAGRAAKGGAFALDEHDDGRDRRVHVVREAERRCRDDRARANMTRCALVRGDGPSPFSAYVGPASWIRSHATGATSAAHALRCDSVTCERGRRAVTTFLRSARRPAAVVWARFDVDDENDDEDERIRRVEAVVEHVVTESPSTSCLLFTFQGGLRRAEESTKLRAAVRNNPKATLPWTEARERSWRSAVNECRTIDAVWVNTTVTQRTDQV